MKHTHTHTFIGIWVITASVKLHALTEWRFNWQGPNVCNVHVHFCLYFECLQSLRLNQKSDQNHRALSIIFFFPSLLTCTHPVRTQRREKNNFLFHISDPCTWHPKLYYFDEFVCWLQSNPIYKAFMPLILWQWAAVTLSTLLQNGCYSLSLLFI